MSALSADYQLDVLRHDIDRYLGFALAHRRAANTRAKWARQAKAINDYPAYRTLSAKAKSERKEALGWLHRARRLRDDLNWIELNHA